jgi:hypothetical protein
MSAIRQSSAFPALTHALHDEGNVPRDNVRQGSSYEPHERVVRESLLRTAKYEI